MSNRAGRALTELRPRSGRPILILDSASPSVSLAVGPVGAARRADGVVTRTLELRRTAELLLHTVDEMLAEIDCGLLVPEGEEPAEDGETEDMVDASGG